MIPFALLVCGCLLARWAGAHRWALWPLPLAVAAAVVMLAGFVTSDRPLWSLMSANSLLVAAPVLIIAFQFPAAGGTALTHCPRRWIMKLAIAYTMAYCLIAPPLNTSGVHWGCRFLLPVYPLMGVLAGGALAKGIRGRRVHGEPSGPSQVAETQPRPDAPTPSIARTALFLVLAGVSVAMQVYSVSLLYRRQAGSGRLNALVAQAPGDVIVTDGWFVPQELAPIFYDRPVFLMTDPDEWTILKKTLKNANASSALFVFVLDDADAPPPSVRVWEDGQRFLRLGLQTVDITE